MRRARRAPLPKPRRRVGSAAIVTLMLVAAVAVALVQWRRPGGHDRTGGGAGAPPPSRDNILLLRSTPLAPITSARTDTRGRARATSIGSPPKACASSGRSARRPSPFRLTRSIFTGLYPFEHGVRNNGNFYLAETIHDARHGACEARAIERGHSSARSCSTAATASPVGSTCTTTAWKLPTRRSSAWRRSGGATRTALRARAGMARAACRPGRQRTVLRVAPPVRPARALSPAAAVPRGLFRLALRRRDCVHDAIVASVLDKLRQLALLDGTMIAVIGDHGESLGDHGEETHSMFVYDAAIRVPLILWRPGRLPAGSVSHEPVPIDGSSSDAPRPGRCAATQAPHARSLLPLSTGKAAAGHAPDLRGNLSCRSSIWTGRPSGC